MIHDYNMISKISRKDISLLKREYIMSIT